MNFERSALFFCTVLASTSSLASSVLEMMTTEYSQDPPIVGTVEIMTLGKSSRVEITSVTSSESGGMIYDASKKEMIALDHDRQEYFVIDEAAMDKMANKVSDAMRQMEEALAAMPPEQRALAEQMMRRQMPQQQVASEEENDTTLVTTGEVDSISGYDCEYIDVMEGDLRIRTLCVTSWDDIEEGREVAAAMMELVDFFEAMRNAFSDAGGLAAIDRQRDMFAYMEELNGYPVLSRDYDDAGALQTESRLRSAGHVDLQPEQFQPPSTYQQQLIP
jgi:hypothetical protein